MIAAKLADVQVWAATEADLEAWRPLVAPMLETLRFSTP